MEAELWRLEKAKMKGIQEPYDFSLSHRISVSPRLCLISLERRLAESPVRRVSASHTSEIGVV